MKKCVAIFVGFSLCAGGLTCGWAAAGADPGDQFLTAYILIQEADAAEVKSDWAKADTKYKAALDLLRDIQKQTPDWNPHIIEFRTRYCTDHVTALKPKLPVPPPQAAPVLPATLPVVSAPASPQPDRIQQLTAELQKSLERIAQLQQERDALKSRLDSEFQKLSTENQAETQKALDQIRALETTRDSLTAKLQEAESKAALAESVRSELQQSQAKLRQLETDRDQLSARLQENLGKTAPAQTTPQIEELLKQNTELTAQVADLKERLAGGTGAPRAAAEQIQLRTELLQTRNELERTKQQLEKANQDLAFTKQELEKAHAENVRLNQSHDQIMARLNEADRQLRATRSSSEKDNEIILQLRKENTVLHQIAEGKPTSPGRTGETRADTGFNNELRGWSSKRRAPTASVTANPARRGTEPSTTAMKESGSNKLVATLNAPVPPAPVEPAPPVVTATSTSAAPRRADTTTNLVVTPAVQAPGPPPAPDTRGTLNEARAAVALKDYDTAALKYQDILTREPNNLTALSNLGAIRYQQGRLEEAEGYLRKASTAAPTDSTARSLLGVILCRKGQLDEAFNELTRAVALDPRNAEAHNYLGITLSEKGWATAAEGEIRRAIELNPQYADAHFNLAVIYAKQKTPHWDLARYHYQKALDLGAQPDQQFDTLLKSAAEKKSAAPEPPKPSSPATP